MLFTIQFQSNIITASTEKTYLVNEKNDGESPVNGNNKANGHSTNGNNLGLPYTKNNHETLISSYDEDEQSTTSSVAAQYDILSKLFRSSNSETLLWIRNISAVKVEYL